MKRYTILLLTIAGASVAVLLLIQEVSEPRSAPGAAGVPLVFDDDVNVPICLIGLTNSIASDGVAAVLGVQKTGAYEWMRISDDGATHAIGGILPPNLFRELAASFDDPKIFDWHMGVAMYTGSDLGVHPKPVQQVLDYLSPE
jgi:hypothetical protein